jgi:pimeloyl-ACP methyl ester carboxylesterase
MLEQFKVSGNTKMVRKLEAAPVTMEGGVPDAYRLVRDDAMHTLGIGTIHTMDSVITGLFLPSWKSPVYTFREKVNLWRGKAQAGISILWDAMIGTDLSQQMTEFSLPIYFLEGVYDYTCSYDLAKEYFGKINAPVRGFYQFEHSAHSPVFEEPEKVRRIFREDILVGRNTLADIR